MRELEKKQQRNIWYNSSSLLQESIVFVLVTHTIRSQKSFQAAYCSIALPLLYSVDIAYFSAGS